VNLINLFLPSSKLGMIGYNRAMTNCKGGHHAGKKNLFFVAYFQWPFVYPCINKSIIIWNNWKGYTCRWRIGYRVKNLLITATLFYKRKGAARFHAKSAKKISAVYAASPCPLREIVSRWVSRKETKDTCRGCLFSIY